MMSHERKSLLDTIDRRDAKIRELEKELDKRKQEKGPYSSFVEIVDELDLIIQRLRGIIDED